MTPKPDGQQHEDRTMSGPELTRADETAPAGTIAVLDSGLPRVGLLDGGQGVAGTPVGVLIPGRRSSVDEETVETRTIDGRPATNRAGAAEYIGLSLASVRVYSSPKNRTRFGWPEPLGERVDRQDWFALEDLDAYKRSASSDVVAPAHGDGDELIGVAEFAAIAGVGRDTFKGFVSRSTQHWDRGEDGYLPLPDRILPAAHGRRYEWRRAKAVVWAGQPRTRKQGRRPGPRPQVADLQAVMAAAPDGGELTNLELAKALSDQFGDVGVQVVQRLKRQLREPQSST